jgi:putative ABC transport system permease protein
LGKGGAFFRQVLVVVQFSISVFLITDTIIVAKQMSYVKHKELGYHQEQMLEISMFNGDFQHNKRAFRQELLSDANISSVCMMSGAPGGFFDQYMFEAEGQNGRIWKARTEFADFEYVKTLGLKIIAGRDLSSDYPTDTSSSVLINRTAAIDLGYKPGEAIGKWIRNTLVDSARRQIVGVVEDFNYRSLKEQIEPLVISPSSARYVALVGVKPGNLSAGIEAVKKAYARAAPGYPFEYSFLDQQFDIAYQRDVRQQEILTLFSGLAIIIACLGLFGLTSFTAAKRTKEIGVRKVLGSSVRNIILLLSRDLLKPVLLAMLIAIPVAYVVMGQWLQNFAYRTGLPWWVFGLSALVTSFIAVGTVSIKAGKAALANPTRSLRSE